MVKAKAYNTYIMPHSAAAEVLLWHKNSWHTAYRITNLPTQEGWETWVGLVGWSIVTPYEWSGHMSTIDQA